IEKESIRLEAEYFLSGGLISKKNIGFSPYPVKPLSFVTEKIFKGNIFKRTYVDNAEFGYPFLTASDMMKSDISSGKFISKRYSNVDDLILDKDWILVSRSGTLGNSVYTNEEFVNVVGTDDLIRIVPDINNIKSGYLYAFLKSKHGYNLLTQSGYGGVVQHIEPHHIEDLPVPILPEEKQQQIHQLIVDSANLRVEANKLLKEAQSTLIS